MKNNFLSQGNDDCLAHMPGLPVMALGTDYQRVLEQGQLDHFLSLLSRDGLGWWFDMDIPRLLAHLEPLQHPAFEQAELPLRIRLLVLVTQPALDEDQLKVFYDRLLAVGDYDAACVAACAGVTAVWDSGREFSRYQSWYEIIEYLLRMKNSISAHACVSLLGFKGLIELTGLGTITVASETFTQQRGLAEREGLNSLLIFGAAANAYCHFYNGNLDAGEIILADACELARAWDITHVSYVYLISCLGFYDTILGRAVRARTYLDTLTAQAWFDLMPPAVWINALGHQLLALSYCGPGSELEAVAKRLRQRVIPEHHAFYHSYSHYNLGVVALRMGQAHRALQHAEIACERSLASHSPLTEVTAPMLKIQALADLNRDSEAMVLMDAYEATWGATEFKTFASLCALERASLLMRNAALEDAQASFQHACDLLPPGIEIPQIGRDDTFVQTLRKQLAPESLQQKPMSFASTNRPVAIATLGELRMRVGDKTIYDRDWHGRQSKLLLLALIVHGGSKVSTSLLSDLLWPDADGDTSRRNLKVAISRLRKVTNHNDMDKLDWLVVKQGRVSLVKTMCWVDAIEFKQYMAKARSPDISLDELQDILELYQDDFLLHDNHVTWIIAHREHLREIFLNGVKVFVRRCLESGMMKESLAFLQKALNLDPLNEPLYVLLMRVYLAQGYHTQAIAVYHQAETVLYDAFGVMPGPKLTALAQQAETGCVPDNI